MICYLDRTFCRPEIATKQICADCHYRFDKPKYDEFVKQHGEIYVAWSLKPMCKIGFPPEEDEKPNNEHRKREEEK